MRSSVERALPADALASFRRDELEDSHIFSFGFDGKDGSRPIRDARCAGAVISPIPE